jgi:hypothetical protein
MAKGQFHVSMVQIYLPILQINVSMAKIQL